MPKYHILSQDHHNSLIFKFSQFSMQLRIYKRERVAPDDTKDSKINLLLDKFNNVVWEKLFDKALLFYNTKKKELISC